MRGGSAHVKPGRVAVGRFGSLVTYPEDAMASIYWGHGFGFGIFAGLAWLSVVIYLLTLATRLVRAIERIATTFEPK